MVMHYGDNHARKKISGYTLTINIAIIMKAIQISSTGAADVLQYNDLPTPQPKPHELQIAVVYAGVNFIDIYFRTGVYGQQLLPFILGQEGVGSVSAIGSNVTNFQQGDKVLFLMGGSGSYAEVTTVSATQVVKIPAAIELKTAAALGIQGLTAHYLTHDTFKLQSGHSALVHAAAGGTGQLLTQLAKARGATVVATVSTKAKAELAHAVGADHVIVYKDYHFSTEVLKFMTAEGLDVVYDSVGQGTFKESLRVLKQRGTLVCYGQASGKIPPFDILQLSTGGSLYLTRPTLTHYIRTSEELNARAEAVFAYVRNGVLQTPRIAKVFPLAEAAAAHKYLETRQAMGKILLACRPA